MKKKNILALACVFLMMIGILSGCGGGEEAAYPAEDISCLVPYAAGGGTDNIARAVAANIDLPVSIACSVMTGARRLYRFTRIFHTARRRLSHYVSESPGPDLLLSDRCQ